MFRHANYYDTLITLPKKLCLRKLSITSDVALVNAITTIKNKRQAIYLVPKSGVTAGSCTKVVSKEEQCKTT